MLRKTLVGLTAAAALATAMGAAATQASAKTTIQLHFGFDGGYQDAGYGYFHCHKKWKWVKVKSVWYDDYGYPHVTWKWKKRLVKFCHTSAH